MIKKFLLLIKKIIEAIFQRIFFPVAISIIYFILFPFFAVFAKFKKYSTSSFEEFSYKIYDENSLERQS